MLAKPDTRLWYRFTFESDRTDPLWKRARGVFYRRVKGNWTWHESRYQPVLIVLVESREDAFLLRLYLDKHHFHIPSFPEGYEDHTTNPPTRFENGVFRHMTPEEVEESFLQESRAHQSQVDEQDDWVQFAYETRRA